jgi:probable rRNA maturation factor
MESVVKTALRLEGRADDPEVSIALVDDNYIRDLNFRYRSIDRATDVLSFPMDETMEDGENILGDIVISTETADRQAGEYNHPFLREMAYLAAHGMFHLLGYDHNDEKNRRVMREKEEKVLSVLDISR